MTLKEHLRHFFLEYGSARTYFIALSGGLDSVVLLSLCYEIRKLFPISLRVIHVNHGFSIHAEQWAEKCANLCKEYSIDYSVHSIKRINHQGNLEEVARNVRYQLFASLLADEDILLTAHHQDDQAETLFIQLLRGSGPKGLSAMPVMKSFARGFHARPLLNFSRQLLKDYADQKKLNWIEDESNQNIKLTRNLIRHEIMPIIKTHFPHAVSAFSRSAKHCAELQHLLEDYVIAEWSSFQGSEQATLSVAKLRTLPVAKQKLILRTWILSGGFKLPDYKKLNTIQQQMIGARWDKNPEIHWDNVILRRYRDNLYLTHAADDAVIIQNYHWSLPQDLYLDQVGLLQATLSSNKGLHHDIREVTICFRQGGEIIDLPKRGRRRLKQLFQEWGIKPWERQKIPLIYFEGQLIAILGYYMHPDYITQDGELGYQITLKKIEPSTLSNLTSPNYSL